MVKIGHLCTIYKGRFKDGTQLAIKEYILLSESFIINKVKREVKNLQNQKSLPIPEFLGICLDRLPTAILIVTKWVPHFTLADLLSGFTKNKMPPKQKQILIRNICRAILELEKGGLSHNALNPSNILLNNDFEVCLTGLSFTSNTDNPLHPYASTSSLIRPRELYYSLPLALHYRTQEMSGSSLLKSSYSDLWSFGMIVLDLFSDAPLFEGCQVPEIMSRTILLQSVNEALFKKEGSCLTLRKSIYDLVTKCCSFDYGLKGIALPSFRDILEEIEALIAQR